MSDLLKYRKPINLTASASVAISGTAVLEIAVPEGLHYFLKQVNLTLDASVTVTDILLDGQSIGEKGTFDVQNVFGSVIPATKKITVNVSNSSTTAAANAKLNIKGFVL